MVFFVLFIFWVFDITYGPILIEWFKENWFMYNNGNFLILNMIFSGIPSLIGIVVGLMIDDLISNRKRLNEVEKILLLIEYELRLNKRILNNVMINPQYVTNFWEIYKLDLKEWNFVNIVTLKEIYGMMELIGQLAAPSHISRYERLTSSNIDYILSRWKEYYIKKARNSAIKQKEDMIEQYDKLQLDEEYKQIINGMKNDIIEIKQSRM